MTLPTSSSSSGSGGVSSDLGVRSFSLLQSSRYNYEIVLVGLTTSRGITVCSSFTISLIGSLSYFFMPLLNSASCLDDICASV